MRAIDIDVTSSEAFRLLIIFAFLFNIFHVGF